MSTEVEVVGVHPVDAPEPCHLIEVVIRHAPDLINLSDFTQEIPDLPPANWQVPWDERYLDALGTRVLDPGFVSFQVTAVSDFRIAFFFHYLDLNRPLLTGFGSVVLPSPSPTPTRLHFMNYEPPD